MLQLEKVGNAEQIEKTAALAHIVWNEHFLPILGQSQVDYMVETFQSSRAIGAQIKEGMDYYLLDVNGEAVGYTALQEDDGLFISKYYILREKRGRGYGRKAMAAIEQIAVEKGAWRLWLKCNKDNAGSLAVYDKLGFEITGEEVSDIGGGFVADDYVLQKEL